MGSIQLAKFIPVLPAIGLLLCGLCCAVKPLRKVAPLIAIAAFLGALGIAISVFNAMGAPEAYAAGTKFSDRCVQLFEWINVGAFHANFSFYIDPLTIVMLFVITGIGSMITIYAAGYMSGDPGYARFFSYFCLFILAMSCLVMADNLVLLYLGWEGVGAASYLLIGFYYKKPSAVAAAKKAFIVNRIGDLGFALGIFCVYLVFGSVEYKAIIPAAQAVLGYLPAESLEGVAKAAYDNALPYMIKDTPAHCFVLAAPFLLMLGAFGKSAQLPLYVWLPDAMEGPTPVSALIHAATMVTSGVYMISRLIVIFQLSPVALPTIAVVGCLTALFGATIAITQYDLKRVWAFSTVSQLGYMFLGVGVESTQGGVFHLVTHAFFKALLFLTAGSVMHALAGQLDMRKISGLWKKMPVTAVLMLCGCLALAGFPFTSGFFSKDTIIAEAYLYHPVLGILGLITAFITAIYSFRLWFRVFCGPTQYEMGDEHHGAEDDAHGHDSHGHDAHGAATGDAAAIKVEHHHDAHEMPFYMNAPLVVLALGAILGGFVLNDWLQKGMVANSTANPLLQASAAHADNAALGGVHDHHHDVHTAMAIISSGVAILGIAIAAYFHLFKRAAADSLVRAYPQAFNFLHNKYYVDELYDAMFRRPLHLLGDVFFVVDSLIIDGLVQAVGFVPRLLGYTVRPTQQGALQGYGIGMGLGAAALLILIVYSLI